MAGLRYAQVEGYLRSSIGALYKDFDLNVALGQLRSIQIFVLGNARQPGEYTVGSLSTLVDAIFSSGGPSATGSMRHILLRREGKTLIDFDLYDVIQKGDKSHDLQLLPGDVIYFSPIGPQIAISGDVDTPGIYELKEKTTVGAALRFAGGMTSLADAERAVLERIEDHSSREVEEFPLNASGQARLLQDGDLLQVFPISPKIQNAVTLRGNVAQPGVYAWKNGMRVSDLIPSRDFLITRNYWNAENHLVPPISLHPFGNSQAGPYANAQSGQLGNPQTGPYESAQSGQLGNPQAGSYESAQADQLGNPQAGQLGYPQAGSYESAQAGQLGNPRYNQFGASRRPIIDTVGKDSAEINWEYALIERLDERDLSTRLIPFRLASALDDPASADNKLLKLCGAVRVCFRLLLQPLQPCKQASGEKAHKREEQNNQCALGSRFAIGRDGWLQCLNNRGFLGFIQPGCVVLLHQHVVQRLTISHFVRGAKVFHARDGNIPEPQAGDSR